MNKTSNRSSLSRRDVLALGTTTLLTPTVFGILGGCGGSGGSTAVGGGARSASALWVQTTLTAISQSKLGPPMVARAIGMAATAAFDAWACYDLDAVGTRLGGQMRRPKAEHTAANKAAAVSFATHRVLTDLFPDQRALFDGRLRSLGFDPAASAPGRTTPASIGRTVADALLEFRHEDGSNQMGGYADTTGYVPVNTPDSVVDPSLWQPLRFANGKSPGFVAPHWGLVVPFAISSPSSMRPPAPPTYATPTYLDRVEEVLELTARLDDEAKVIAEYWADGPGTALPPGHWQEIGLFVSQRDGHGLDEDVKMFFMLGNAVMDAGIACWDCKRHFNTSRPITAIRALKAGARVKSFGGPGRGMIEVDGSKWHPYQSVNFVTPPFPEYTSGHSTFSSASAEVLRLFTGRDDYGGSVTVTKGASAFDPSVPARPVTLSWATFSDAADQAGLSRRYGGIHFEAGDREGRRCGRLVGRQVYEKAMAFVRGAEPNRPA